ncbi:MAG: hypothetical protein V3V78_04875 [Candidatus Woesearchaeota archaeon]
MNKCHRNKFVEHFRKLRFQKKAQEARSDLAVWYSVCFALIFLAVLSLYGLGIVGDDGGSGSLIESNQITAAAIAVPVEESNINSEINETNQDNSLVADSG